MQEPNRENKYKQSQKPARFPQSLTKCNHPVENRLKKFPAKQDVPHENNNKDTKHNKKNICCAPFQGILPPPYSCTPGNFLKSLRRAEHQKRNKSQEKKFACILFHPLTPSLGYPKRIEFDQFPYLSDQALIFCFNPRASRAFDRRNRGLPEHGSEYYLLCSESSIEN